MTDDELNILVRKAKSGDRDATARIINELTPKIKHTASAWKIPGLESGDIFVEASLCVLDAIQSYDEHKGGGFFWPWAKRKITQGLQKIKKPAKKVDDGETHNEFLENRPDHLAAEVDNSAFNHDDIKIAWRFLTHSEKRAVLATLGSAKWTEVAFLEGVSKQAIHKAMYSARVKILAVKSGEARLRQSPPSSFDYLLYEVLRG